MTKLHKPASQPKNLRIITRGLQLIPWLGSLLPGITYYKNWAPPFFPAMGILFSVIGLAVLLRGYYPSQSRKDQTRKSIIWLLISLFFLVCYCIVLNYCTAVPPADRTGPRRQIGFYMWPLTEKASNKIKELAATQPLIEVNTPDDLMNVIGVWGDKGSENEIWYPWSIIAAGFLLVFLYVVAFISWTYGMGLLLRVLRNRSLVVN